jgi:gluconate 2-dehydrogenase gamma chain
MQRRDVLRLLATGSALQLAPQKLMVFLREARNLLAEQKSPRILNPHQYATVTTMAELILPRTDTPGATDVGTSDFIDLLLADWYEPPQRKQFLGGLADVDTRAQKLFGKDLVDCSTQQQSQILIDLGAKMVEEAEQARVRGISVDSTEELNFYSTLRRLTLTAYYTSEDGASKELHFEIIPDRYQGCAPAPAKEAAKQE